MIPSLKEENGSIITKQERILERCAEFYETLYEDTVQNITKLETEEVPSILTSEVERSLKPNGEQHSTRRRPDCSRNDKSRRRDSSEEDPGAFQCSPKNRNST